MAHVEYFSSSAILACVSCPPYTEPPETTLGDAGNINNDHKTMLGSVIGPGGTFLRRFKQSLRDSDSPPSSAADRIPSLDVIRALSHLWVISHHSVYALAGHLPPSQFLYFFNGNALAWQASGHWAVDAFFMLSAILHTLHLLDRLNKGEAFHITYRRFIGTRLVRLWPMLLLAILFHALVPVGLPFDSHKDRFNFADYLSLLLFFPSFPYYTGMSVSSQGTHHYTMLYLWTIETEMQFYLVIPFLAFLIHRCKHRVLKLLLAVALSIAMHCLHCIILHQKGLLEGSNYPPCYYDMDLKGCEISQIEYYSEYVTLYARFPAFAFGIIAAVLHRYFNTWMRYLFQHGIISIAILYIAADNFHTTVLKERREIPEDFYEDATFLAPSTDSLMDIHVYSRLRYNITPFLACTAILAIDGARGASLNGVLNAIFANTVVKTISDLSYTNYFVHCYFITGMYAIFPPNINSLFHSQFSIMLFFNIVLSLAMSYIIHRFYEKPFVYLMHKRLLNISDSTRSATE
eukprot:Nk52_evm20s263 gene=Nk52_evmTU20s263